MRVTLKKHTGGNWTMIVKTRQPLGIKTDHMGLHAMNTVGDNTNQNFLSAKSRGVLRLPPSEANLQVSRTAPSPRLAQCIAYYWKVSWDLRGRPPHLQETLPHPNMYLVFEKDRLQISGVTTTKFTRLLEDQGFAFGVKFKPGGLRPFLSSAASSLTNQILAANQVFGPAGDGLEAALLACHEEQGMVTTVDSYFARHAPEPNQDLVLADRLVGEILRCPQIKTVDDLAKQENLSQRSLQRLFREYIGVPPKWVIQRYRLHELVGRLEAGGHLNWPDLALELGYFDQAHLIKDFKAITGYSPAEYQRG